MPSLVVAAERLLRRLRHCQRADLVGDHATLELVRGRLDRGLGIRSGIARALRDDSTDGKLGEPSRFGAGDWVRVLDAAALREKLDDRDRTRGLWFTETQWDYAGRVFQVVHDVRRIRDDRGGYRPVSRTVLLDGADCGGLGRGSAGCGRRCPLMFRDEWLEPATAQDPVARREPRYARVRPFEDISRGLDLRNRHDGLTFMPEMRRCVGMRFEIAFEIHEVYELGRWVRTRDPLYVLENLRCTGASCGTRGPCHRACNLVWHRDWLDIEGEVVS